MHIPTTQVSLHVYPVAFNDSILNCGSLRDGANLVRVERRCFSEIGSAAGNNDVHAANLLAGAKLLDSTLSEVLNDVSMCWIRR